MNPRKFSLTPALSPTGTMQLETKLALTPALSPEERENPWQSASESPFGDVRKLAQISIKDIASLVGIIPAVLATCIVPA